MVLSIRLRETAIVRKAGPWSRLVGAMRRLEPPPVARLMHSDTEPQALFSRRGGPGADNIAMGTDRGGIPRLMLRIPGIKTVMVIGQCDEYPRAGVFVARDQLIRIPIQQGPLGAKLFVAESRWRPVMFQLIFVLPLVFYIHVACVPVPSFGHALRTPMSPDAEFGILVPFRGLVIEQ